MARAVSIRGTSHRVIGFLRVGALFCVFQIDPAFAGERPDKRRYNLFHPTPDALLREMATDRPDKTESAYSVDAGHYQIEMDYALTRDILLDAGMNIGLTSAADDLNPFIGLSLRY